MAPRPNLLRQEKRPAPVERVVVWQRHFMLWIYHCRLSGCCQVVNKGSTDMARDVRGFAVKFYTKQGNWDLVGNNIPVFFIQDAIKFPDLIHAVKEEPDRGFPQAQSAHDTF